MPASFDDFVALLLALCDPPAPTARRRGGPPRAAARDGAEEPPSAASPPSHRSQDGRGEAPATTPAELERALRRMIERMAAAVS